MKGIFLLLIATVFLNCGIWGLGRDTANDKLPSKNEFIEFQIEPADSDSDSENLYCIRFKFKNISPDTIIINLWGISGPIIIDPNGIQLHPFMKFKLIIEKPLITVGPGEEYDTAIIPCLKSAYQMDQEGLYTVYQLYDGDIVNQKKK